MDKLPGNNQDITAPIKKQDKIIRPSEMPKKDEPSSFQAPKKPGYDVAGRDPAMRSPEQLAEVYSNGIQCAEMGADYSMDATNRMGGPAGNTRSDPSGIEPIAIQHPALAEKPRGENTPDTVESVRIRGCGSDDAFDRFPDRQRSNAMPDSDDR